MQPRNSTSLSLVETIPPSVLPEEKGRILVLGGGMQYIRMFFDKGWRGARNIEEADVVCFTGGEDVDPAYYGEKPLKGTDFNSRRDEWEMEAFGQALMLDIPMVGICRGSQFLNVASGGKLWQHVDNHCGSHSVLDTRTKKTMINMTSTHHQQMIPAEKGVSVLAVASKSLNKFSFGKELTRQEPRFDDVEAVWYEATKALCFQPHPEFYEGTCRDYFFELFDEFVTPLVKRN